MKTKDIINKALELRLKLSKQLDEIDELLKEAKDLYEEENRFNK